MNMHDSKYIFFLDKSEDVIGTHTPTQDIESDTY